MTGMTLDDKEWPSMPRDDSDDSDESDDKG